MDPDPEGIAVGFAFFVVDSEHGPWFNGGSLTEILWIGKVEELLNLLGFRL